MQRTRKEALDEFLGKMGELGDSGARDLAEAELNTAIETIATARIWRDLLSPAPIELTLTANQRSYALPDYFARIPAQHRIMNLTRGTEIYERTQAQLLTERPMSGTSLEQPSAPAVIVIAGVCGVHTQPASTGEALEVLSDHAGDTTIRVSIEGEDGNGRHKRVSLQLNGTTPVAAGTWRWIDSFGKSYPAGTTPATEYTSSRGSVTLRKVTGAVELQYLFPEESAHEHRVITFAPKPDQADVIAIPCVRRPKRLIYDGDPLPGDWWPALREEMEAQWRSNNGEVSSAAAVPRPKLVQLMASENVNGPQPLVRPFGVRRPIG